MSKENFVIFKNPNLRYRNEEFGGIARLNLKTFILNKIQYNLIERIQRIILYGNLTSTEKKVADRLIDEKILLKINLERARELGFKEGDELEAEAKK